MSKYYYVGHSYMGLNFTYDSPCWRVYKFASMELMRFYLEHNERDENTGNYVAQRISRKTAEKIGPLEEADELLYISDRNTWTRK